MLEKKNIIMGFKQQYVVKKKLKNQNVLKDDNEEESDEDIS